MRAMTSARPTATPATRIAMVTYGFILRMLSGEPEPAWKEGVRGRDREEGELWRGVQVKRGRDQGGHWKRKRGGERGRGREGERERGGDEEREGESGGVQRETE